MCTSFKYQYLIIICLKFKVTPSTVSRSLHIVYKQNQKSLTQYWIKRNVAPLKLAQVSCMCLYENKLINSADGLTFSGLEKLLNLN